MDSSGDNEKPSQQTVPSSSWTCQVCTLENPQRRKRCGACEARRPLHDESSNKEPPRNVEAGSSSKVALWLRKRKRKRKRNKTEDKIQSGAERTLNVYINVDGEPPSTPLVAGIHRDDGECGPTIVSGNPMKQEGNMTSASESQTLPSPSGTAPTNISQGGDIATAAAALQSTLPQVTERDGNTGSNDSPKDLEICATSVIGSCPKETDDTKVLKTGESFNVEAAPQSRISNARATENDGSMASSIPPAEDGEIVPVSDSHDLSNHSGTTKPLPRSDNAVREVCSKSTPTKVYTMEQHGSSSPSGSNDLPNDTENDPTFDLRTPANHCQTIPPKPPPKVPDPLAEAESQGLPSEVPQAENHGSVSFSGSANLGGKDVQLSDSNTNHSVVVGVSFNTTPGADVASAARTEETSPVNDTPIIASQSMTQDIQPTQNLTQDFVYTPMTQCVDFQSTQDDDASCDIHEEEVPQERTSSLSVCGELQKAAKIDARPSLPGQGNEQASVGSHDPNEVHEKELWPSKSFAPENDEIGINSFVKEGSFAHFSVEQGVEDFVLDEMSDGQSISNTTSTHLPPQSRDNVAKPLAVASDTTSNTSILRTSAPSTKETTHNEHLRNFEKRDSGCFRSHDGDNGAIQSYKQNMIMAPTDAESFMSLGSTSSDIVNQNDEPVESSFSENPDTTTGISLNMDPCFTTAGKNSKILVSAKSLEMAERALATKSTTGNRVESGVSTKSTMKIKAHPARSRSTAQIVTTSKINSMAAVAENSRNHVLRDNLIREGRDEPRIASDKQGTFAPFFTTAGMKTKITISDESMTKAEQFLVGGDVIRSDKPPSAACHNEILALSPGSPSKLAYFKTAGAKAPVTVSAERITKATKILEHSNRAGNRNFCGVEHAPLVPVENQMTLQTSNKAAYSSRSLVLAEGLHDDECRPMESSSVDDRDTMSAKRSAVSQTSYPPDASVFKTAKKQKSSKGSIVTIDQHLERHSTNHYESQDTDNADAVKTTKAATRATPQPESFSANNAPAEVSPDSLASVGRSVEESALSDSRCETLSIAQSKDSRRHKVSDLSSTFATSNNTRVCEQSMEGIQPTPNVFPQGAFFTAAGSSKRVVVTTESVDKAAKFLEGSHSYRRDEPLSSFFSTAAKKTTIGISTESMTRAEQLLGKTPSSFGEDNRLATQATDKTENSLMMSSQPSPPLEVGKEANASFSKTMANATPATAPHCNIFARSGQNEGVSLARIPSDVVVGDKNAEQNGAVDGGVEKAPFAKQMVKFSVNEAGTTEQVSLDKTKGLEVAFTPKQPPTFPPAIVTMSTDIKQKLHRIQKTALDESREIIETPQNIPFTPVPFRFNHIEGRFRGKAVSPSSISHAERLFSGDSASNGQVKIRGPQQKTEMSVSPGVRRKVVRWMPGDEVSMLSLSQCATLHGGLADDATDSLRLGVSPLTLQVDSENATHLRFDSERGLPCSFCEDYSPGAIGSAEELSETLVSQGCHAKALTSRWVLNHKRWVVWKLASMERRFPSLLAGRYLTYENLLLQLRSRYEKEYKGGLRSALRKVLNRDVAPSSLMILCVSKLLCHQACNTGIPRHNEWALELTDGWYSVRAVLDTHLSEHLMKGKIRVGSKLLICNASMKGAEDGIDPLDETYSSTSPDCSIFFRVAVNSTRLARWDAKMGFVRPSASLRSQHGMMLVKSISHIKPGGGNVPLIDLMVCKRYPILFLEHKKSKESDAYADDASPTFLVLTEAQENRARTDLEKRKRRAVDKLSESIQGECEKAVDEEAPEIWGQLIKNDSPIDFYERLDASDKLSIDKWKEQRAAILQDRVCKEIDAALECDSSMHRESTPFVRYLVKAVRQFGTRENAIETDDDSNGAINSDSASETALLTAWSLSEEQLGVLKEGSVIRFRNLSVRQTTRDGLIQLSASRKIPMETVSSHSPDFSKAGFQHRSFSSLFKVHVLSKKLFNKVISQFPAPEVDTAGVVLKVIRDAFEAGGRSIIYVADESGLLLRVHCDHEHFEPVSIQPFSMDDHSDDFVTSTLFLQDVRVMSFDPSENCAVAVVTESSSVPPKKRTSHRRAALKQWCTTPAGCKMLSTLSNCLDGCIPMTRETSTTSLPFAVGYIVGFSVPSEHVDESNSESAPLRVVVDCGSTNLHVWEFPLDLIGKTLSLCKNARDMVAVKQQEERIHLNLNHLGLMLDRSGVLVHFLLRKQKLRTDLVAENQDTESGSVYRVENLRAANPRALAAVYSSSLSCSGRLLPKEQKSPARSAAPKSGTGPGPQY